MKEYRLPKKFIEDHDDRNLLRRADGSEMGEIISLDDVVVKQTKSHYIVNLTIEQANELMSDADYYATPGVIDPSLFGLCSSARATVKALLAQGVEPIKPTRFRDL